MIPTCLPRSSFCIKAAFVLYLMSFTSSPERKKPPTIQRKVKGGDREKAKNFFSKSLLIFLKSVFYGNSHVFGKPPILWQQAFRLLLIDKFVNQITFYYRQIRKCLDSMSNNTCPRRSRPQALPGRNLKPGFRTRFSESAFPRELPRLRTFQPTLEGRIYLLADRNLPAV
jgi:hypothetical protein